MEQYKIKQDGFKEVRKKLLIKAIPLSVLAFIGGLAISYFNSNDPQNMIGIFPFLIPIMLGVLAFGLLRGVNRQKEVFESFTLVLDKDSITRIQNNTTTIHIPNTDVSEIIKNSNGSFTIKGNSSVNIIGVPLQIDDYEKLEQALAEIKTITIKNKVPFLEKISGLVTLLSIGLIITVYVSMNKIIVGVSGTILLVILGYSFIKTQTSKNIDSKTKKRMCWLLLVTASILAVMYYKLFI